MGQANRPGPHPPEDPLDLCLPGPVQALLSRHGLQARKRLGQHFLVSRPVVERITASTSHCRGVLEVGPGIGVLTQPLSQASQVTAVEVDPKMASILTETAPRAHIIHADALQADLRALLEDLPRPRALVSNMPYNITGPLLERFAQVRDLYERAVLMMQREVALKVLAQAGDSDRGALSVVMQSGFRIRKLCEAPAGAFLPPPKVDSCVLELDVIEPLLSNTCLDLVRKGFTQPRKTLANNLSSHGYDRDRVNSALDLADLPGSIRPHQLEMDQWRDLCRTLSD